MKGLTIRISDRGDGWRADRNQGSGMTSAFTAATVSGPTVSVNASLLLAGCIPASVAVLLTAWLWTTRQWAFVQGAMFVGLGVVFWWAATASPNLDNLEVCAAFAALATGLTLVLSFGLRALRRETSEHDVSLLSVLRETSRTIATSESERNRSQVRKRILEAVDDDVVTVLGEIANGTLDISNPTSISRIEAHESDLRSVIAVASHPGELGECLMPLVASARNNGRTLRSMA